MQMIKDQTLLEAFLKGASDAPYITVDTEFLRESTYFAQLCLVQVAYPGEGNVAVIDVLAKGVDLAPLIDIFKNTKIIKVFHAARQDLEIFFHDYGVLPEPFFDTQIAAMVAGYGDQASYESLVKSLTDGKIDKSKRFTDWRKRPLSASQIDYAAADVTYLREVYEKLKKRLEANGRLAWVEDDMSALLKPELYQPSPEDAYKRVRSRVQKRRFMAYVRELAAVRERFAIEQNLPRNRLFKDDALLEAAAQRPKNLDALKSLRLWRGGVNKALAEEVIEAIKVVDKLSPDDYPEIEKAQCENKPAESVTDLLRVYLKAQSERFEVAPKLICTMSELDQFACDPEAEHPLNRGWRLEIFGKEARALLQGKAALQSDGKFVKLIEV